jgi:hypothetical protein
MWKLIIKKRKQGIKMINIKTKIEKWNLEERQLLFMCL